METDTNKTEALGWNVDNYNVKITTKPTVTRSLRSSVLSLMVSVNNDC